MSSVEKETRKALRRVVLWRLLGDAMALPQVILAAIAAAVAALSGWIKNVEMAIFYYEVDAARRYKLLTGVDLGMATGAPGRYGMVNHPDIAAEAHEEYVRKAVGDQEYDDGA